MAAGRLGNATAPIRFHAFPNPMKARLGRRGPDAHVMMAAAAVTQRGLGGVRVKR